MGLNRQLWQLRCPGRRVICVIRNETTETDLAISATQRSNMIKLSDAILNVAKQIDAHDKQPTHEML